MSLEVGLAGSITKTFLMAASFGGTTLPTNTMMVETPRFPKIEACMMSAVNNIDLPGSAVVIQRGTQGDVRVIKHIADTAKNDGRTAQVGIGFILAKNIMEFRAEHGGSYGDIGDIATSASDGARAQIFTPYVVKARTFEPVVKRYTGWDVGSLQGQWAISASQQLAEGMGKCLHGKRGERTTKSGLPFPTASDISAALYGSKAVKTLPIFVAPKLVGN